MTERLLREKIISKLSQLYGGLSADRIESLADRLLLCSDELRLNLSEWSEGKPLSDVWIRDKYCINAVLQIRRDDDFAGAFIALDEYAKNPEREHLIWQQRM